MLAFEAYTYNFLILKGLGAFLLIKLTFLSEGEIANDNSIVDKVGIDFLGIKFRFRFRFRFENVDSLVFSMPLLLMENQYKILLLRVRYFSLS